MRLSRRSGRPEPEASREFDRTWQPRLWAILTTLALVVAYVIGFVVANDERIDVNFLFTTARTSLIWVILLSLGIGVLAGVLLSQLYRRRAR